LLLLKNLELFLPSVSLRVKIAALALLILPNLWCILQAVKNDFRHPPEKIFWMAAGVFLPVVGGFLYLAWGRTRIKDKKL
jgi:hypothetical protein